jgi:hypothetical protein
MGGLGLSAAALGNVLREVYLRVRARPAKVETGFASGRALTY